MKKPHAQSTTVLVPAAGYGTRMGSPHAKEMLPNAQTKRPLIDFAFKIVTAIPEAKAHVITRQEKSDLIDYVGSRGANVQIIEPSKEWPHSILLSMPFWSEKNLLLLPDTEFAPQSSASIMLQALDSVDLAVGVFDAPDLNTFGAFKTVNEEHWHAEKPQDDLTGAKAWGLIAFRKSIGQQLFENMLASTFDHKWRKLPFKTQFVSLDRFVDLTRG